MKKILLLSTFLCVISGFGISSVSAMNRQGWKEILNRESVESYQKKLIKNGGDMPKNTQTIKSTGKKKNKKRTSYKSSSAETKKKSKKRKNINQSNINQSMSFVTKAKIFVAILGLGVVAKYVYFNAYDLGIQSRIIDLLGKGATGFVDFIRNSVK